MFKKIFKELNIFLLVLLIFCPVNIIFYLGENNFILFNQSFSYSFQSLFFNDSVIEISRHTYFALPLNILTGIVLLTNIYKNPNHYFKNNGHLYIYFLLYLLINILILSFLLFNETQFRLIKNFISVNCLIFFIYCLNIYCKNISYSNLKKIEIYFLNFLAIICISNLIYNFLWFDNSIIDQTKGQFILGLQIAHYLDYFPPVILLTIVYLLSIIKLENIDLSICIYLLIFIFWFLYAMGIGLTSLNKGATITIYSFLIIFIVTIKSNFLKNFIKKNLYLLYFPLLVFLYLAIFQLTLVYGVDASIADRLRTFTRNFDENINYLIPIMTDSKYNYHNFHNDFLDIYYLYGIFAFIIFNFIFLKIRKILKINYIFGIYLIVLFSLFSLVQNNLLNPYFIIIFSFFIAFVRNKKNSY
tara:strand:- start:5260 stop:6504 length:1245 start_codon:yes stop_codon:yes gene_type:complete